MKLRTFILFIPILACKISTGQNLVPNWSFEQFHSCPTDQGEITYSDDWLNYKEAGEYFNSCDSAFGYGVPYNTCGYQQAASGNAYAGIYTFSLVGTQSTSFRDYIGVELTQPLQVGVKYFVNF